MTVNMAANMYSAETLLKIAVSLVFTVIISTVISQQFDVKEMYKMCQKKSNATDDELSAFLRSQSIPSTEHGKLTKEGKYNAEGIYEMAKRSYTTSPEHLVQAKKVVDSCAKEVMGSQDKCDVAVKVANCTMMMSQKIGLGSA